MFQETKRIFLLFTTSLFSTARLSLQKLYNIPLQYHNCLFLGDRNIVYAQ